MKPFHHAHFTLQDCSIEQIKQAAKLIKGKVTSIDLWKDSKNQIDRMITKYYKNVSNVKSDEEILTGKGFVVNRVKIEQSVSYRDFVTLVVKNPSYLEAHIQCWEDVGDIDGFVKSKNLDENGCLFYNYRASKSIDKKFINGIKKLREVIKKEQYEISLYDSNNSLDYWWAKPA